MTSDKDYYEYYYIHGKNEDGLRIYGYTDVDFKDVLEKYKEESHNPSTLIQQFVKHEYDNLEIKGLRSENKSHNPDSVLQEYIYNDWVPINHYLNEIEKMEPKTDNLQKQLEECYERVEYYDYHFNRYIDVQWDGDDTDMSSLHCLKRQTLEDFKRMKVLQEALQALVESNPYKLDILKNMIDRTIKAQEFNNNKIETKTDEYTQLNNIIPDYN